MQTSYFVGVFSGSYIIGELIKLRGRAFLIKTFFMLQLVYGVMVLLISNYLMLLFVWLIYGFFNGFCMNMLNSFAAELAPSESRGKWMVLFSSTVAIGKILSSVQAILTFNPVIIDNWKY